MQATKVMGRGAWMGVDGHDKAVISEEVVRACVTDRVSDVGILAYSHTIVSGA